MLLVCLLYTSLTPDIAIYEIKIPESWLNKTIIEKAVRTRYHVSILATKKNGDVYKRQLMINVRLLKSYKDYVNRIMQIKICGLFQVEDIDYVNEAKPDYVGFVFAKSKRQVDIHQAEKLKNKLDSNIKAVGVFAVSYTHLDVYKRQI